MINDFPLIFHNFLVETTVFYIKNLCFLKLWSIFPINTVYFAFLKGRTIIEKPNYIRLIIKKISNRYAKYIYTKN